jgi:signal recognition particle receptor subunit beta
MVLFNYSTKELTAKIVYYGPGLCGKTTNLQFVYDNLPKEVQRGKMLSLATKTDRTLFFDFLPLDLGTIRGMKTRLQLYTVPGQVFYNSTRKMVLKGADGVVFVADSQAKMLDANIESFANLEENLAEQGLKLEQIPHVLQFNKRDLPGLGSIEDLNTALNKYNAPFYEAIAINGIGVHDTLKAITKLVLNSLTNKYKLEKGGPPPQAAGPERPAAPRPAPPRPAPAPTPRPAAAPAAAAAPRPTSIPVALAAADEEENPLELIDQEGETLLELVDEPEPADPGATMRLSAAPPKPKHPPRPPLDPEPGLDDLEVIPLGGAPAAPAPRPAQAAAPPRPAPAPPAGGLSSLDEEAPSSRTLTLRLRPGESQTLTVPVRIEAGGRTIEYVLRIELQPRSGR